MKNITILFLLSSLLTLLSAQELKVKANSFTSDQNTGVSVFSGDVNILKENDELNASKVTIYVDKKKQPTKFVAVGNVSFSITSKNGGVYKGVAGKAIYLPSKKEYYFYENVHLQKKEPVIMIFKIDEEKK